MKILYVHAFGGHYDPEHPKIQSLETLGKVVGIDLEYCQGFSTVQEKLKQAVFSEHPDLLIGTGMGGHVASHVGAACGIPFVALNPMINPSQDLSCWVGNISTPDGRDHYLTESACETYPEFALDGYGLVFVESGDAVVNATHTVQSLNEHYTVEKFSGGNHGFVHIDQALPMIKEFYNQAEDSYGVDNE